MKNSFVHFFLFNIFFIKFSILLKTFVFHHFLKKKNSLSEENEKIFPVDLCFTFSPKPYPFWWNSVCWDLLFRELLNHLLTVCFESVFPKHLYFRHARLPAMFIPIIPNNICVYLAQQQQQKPNVQLNYYHRVFHQYHERIENCVFLCKDLFFLLALKICIPFQFILKHNVVRIVKIYKPFFVSQ
jgi:hypothetical protein